MRSAGTRGVAVAVLAGMIALLMLTMTAQAADPPKKIIGWVLDPQIIKGKLAAIEGSKEDVEGDKTLKIDEVQATPKGGFMRYSFLCLHTKDQNNGPHWRKYQLEWGFDGKLEVLRPGMKRWVRIKATRIDNLGSTCPPSNNRAIHFMHFGFASPRVEALKLPAGGGEVFLHPPDGGGEAWDNEGRIYAAPDVKDRTDVTFPVVVTDAQWAWGSMAIHVWHDPDSPGVMYIFRAVYQGETLPPESAGTGPGTDTKPIPLGPGDTGTGGTSGTNTGSTGTGGTDGTNTGTTGTGGTGGTNTGTTGTGGTSGTNTGTTGTGGTGGTNTGTTGIGGTGTGATNTGGSTSVPPWGPTDPATNVGGMTLQAGARRVLPGQLITVPIWLINGAGLANMNFTVRFDPKVAIASGTAIARGTLLPNSMLFEANAGEAGLCRIGLAGNSDIGGTGPVARITFRAVGQPGDRTRLALQVTVTGSAAGGKPAVATIDGEIVIVGPGGLIPGDSNGNGVLDPGDAMDALKMSVKLIPENLIVDMDKDGQVTSIDARLILQKVVGK